MELNEFIEENESYSMSEAIKEAQRCLHCKVPQCKKGCPISNDIPDWIHELSKGNMGNAISIIRTKSNLPAICGRVCGHEKQCEGSCVLNKKGQHINIGKLERFVADFDAVTRLTHDNVPEQKRGKVAVIGAGPAGLTVSGDLVRMGFHVEIFEMEQQCGGMLRYGIPEYRLPKEVVAREVRHIEEMGVTIHRNTHVGKDITVDGFFRQGFDAVFIGTGTGKPRNLDIPGADSKCVRLATHFLRRVELFQEGFIDQNEVHVQPGHKVFVVGAGNTAMDASRTALRIGAESVHVIFFDDEAHIAALRAEYEDAVKEGVQFLWFSNLREIHTDENDEMTEIVIEVIKPSPTADDPEARTSETITMPADRVIMAIGATPETRIVRTTSGIESDSKGFLITRDIPYGMTSRKGVFASGDVAAARKATVVHAMADAKKVAEGIAQYVDAMKLMETIKMNDFAG